MSVELVADLPRRERGVVVGRRDGRLGDFWRRGHGGGLAQRSTFDPRGAAQGVAEHSCSRLAPLSCPARGRTLGVQCEHEVFQRVMLSLFKAERG